MSDSIPDIAIIDEKQISHSPPEEFQRSHSAHIDIGALADGEKKRRETIEYFKELGITQTLSELVERLVREQPPDPVRFCGRFLRSAQELQESAEHRASKSYAEDVDPRDAIRKQLADGAPMEYVENHKLAGLFDDLLTQLVAERPPDPHNFCLTWLRWHRHVYDGSEPISEGSFSLSQ
eukprot:NODE_3710_length_930_cov_22.628831_g3410_i0.p1 GENE.NODE_3710_length_930_cov_22.628831_g3410_i0~~NODE_3710_length_930_cov_22.628831_g3410_i0.p1  ORF type:complete len:179 (-),score=37.71 NODE_3710_length_930_cov_22.628831_g3410_i0:176-712(-)